MLKKFNPALWKPLGIKPIKLDEMHSTTTKHNGFVEYQAPETRYEVRGIMPKAPKKKEP